MFPCWKWHRWKENDLRSQNSRAVVVAVVEAGSDACGYDAGVVSWDREVCWERGGRCGFGRDGLVLMSGWMCRQAEMRAELDRMGREKKDMAERIREVENQLEWVRSEREEEIGKLVIEKKGVQDWLRDTEGQIAQLKSRKRDELKVGIEGQDEDKGMGVDLDMWCYGLRL